MTKGIYDRKINVMNKSDINRRYRVKHLEEIRQKGREYYHKNKSKINQVLREKRKNNPKTIQRYRVQQKTSWHYEHKPCCEMCGSKDRIQHHHFTSPPSADYFIDVCNNCHPICERYNKLINSRLRAFNLADVEQKIEILRLKYRKIGSIKEQDFSEELKSSLQELGKC